MAGPWEKFQQPQQGPWAKFGGTSQQTPQPEQPPPPVRDESVIDLLRNPPDRQPEFTPPPLVGLGKEALPNVPSSAAGFVKNIYEALRHPVDSWTGLASAVAGGIQKAIPGEQGNEPDFDKMIGFFKERYGSPSQMRQTFIEDPVGTAADISGALMAGGGVLRLGGAAGRSAGLADAGQTLSRAGAAVDPINAASRTVTRAVGALVPENAPARMYESAAKFSTTIPEDQRMRMANLALDEGIMPTGGGVEKTRGMIDTLNDEISTLIDNATQTGQTIDQNNLFRYLDEVRKDAILTGKPLNNLNAIDRVENQIRTINAKLQRGTLTPAEAQRLKQNIYKDVNYASGKEKVRYAEEAQKAVARAAKEELERIYPQIKGLNAREGALIELLKSIERSASRIGNRDIMGIGTPLKGTMGGVVAGAEGAIAGTVAGILDNPSVKAKLAIALRRAQNRGLSVPGAPARQAAFQAGRSDYE